MGFERFLDSRAEWVSGQGDRADVVISSRVRLARNFDGIRFGEKATPEMREAVLGHGRRILEESDYFRGADLFCFRDLTPLQHRVFVERHMVSPAYAEQPEHVGMLVGRSNIVSAVLNEEDHLRLQAIRGGFTPRETWDVIRQIDDDLERFLPYSFSERWGYLTACATNTGTGMRASVLIHLPGLVLTREIGKVLNGVAQVNLVVRGFYGEGTEVMGNLFQISNQKTLGISEERLIEQLERVTLQVLEYEMKAREAMTSGTNRLSLSDKIWRGIGELKSARLLTSKEVINLASIVRLGISLEIVDGLDLKTLNEIVLLSQPAHLQIGAEQDLKPEERDELRASLVRSKLAHFDI